MDKEPSLGEGIRHVYVIRIENGRGVYRYRPGLRPGWTVSGVIPGMDQAQPLGEFTKSIADDLAGRLTASGLFAKEARAMVNTWASSYFQTDGSSRALRAASELDRRVHSHDGHSQAGEGGASDGGANRDADSRA